MRQDKGGDADNMLGQTAAAWPLDIEHRGQGTEERFDPMPDAAQGPLGFSRPALALIVLAQGQEQDCGVYARDGLPVRHH